MIKSEILEILNSDQKFFENSNPKIVKVPIVTGYTALYSGAVSQAEEYYFDIFDIRFFAVWDHENQKFLIRYEEEANGMVQKLGLGDSEDIGYLPRRFDVADRIKLSIIEEMNKRMQENSERKLLENLNLDEIEFERANSGRIETLAVQRIIDQDGLDNPQNIRWLKSSSSAANKTYLWMMDRWSEALMMDILTGEVKVDDLAKEFIESHSDELDFDVLIQIAVERRADEIRRGRSWVNYKVGIYQALREIKEQHANKIWVYYLNADDVGNMYQVTVDGMLGQGYDQSFEIAGKKIRCDRIYQIKWQRNVIYSAENIKRKI